MADTPICIDISHYQGYPDFEKVRDAGVRGVIHKATEGTSYIDPYRAYNLNAAREAGLAIATYFWLKPGDAAVQAKFYLSTINPVHGERVIIDYEEQGVTLEMLHDAVRTLLDHDAGLQITVYSGSIIKEQLGDGCDAFLADNTDLWLAQWTTGKLSWPSGTWPDWALHQYSETGEVDGIAGHVDLDEFNGDADAFLAWITPAGMQPQPEPKPQSAVTVAIVAPDDVAVTVTVNGAPAAR